MPCLRRWKIGSDREAGSDRDIASVGAPPRPRLLTRTLDLVLHRTTSLSSDQQSRLFRLFAELHREQPRLLPGVSRLAGTDRYFLLTEFSSTLLHRYNGFEFAVFDARSATYYRMPGARAGANGNVAHGDHALRLDHWNLRRPLYLRLDNAPGGSLRVSSAGFFAEPGVQYRLLEGHHLDHAKLSVELEEQVHRYFVWHLLSLEYTPSVAATVDMPALRDRLDDCAALGPRLSGVAAGCRKRLSASAAVPDHGAPTRSHL